MDSMVDIRQLTKRFGPITAVDDISFVVRRGEVLGFLGPNGAGKSTTMKMITGFLNPDAGTIVVGGHSIAHHPIRTKQRIGYLPEGAPLYGEMTVRAFLGFVAEVRGFRGAKRAECIDQVAEKVNIGSVLEQPIETLSKGFKRRVGLGQAILHDPDILVLDEPTDGLDPNQKHEVRDLIRGMAENKAIILSTHILEEVEAVCTRAIIIAAGRIVSDGSPSELAARSALHNALTLTVRRGATDGDGGEVDSAAQDIDEALQSLTGVKEVSVLERSGELTRYQLLPADGASLVQPVSQLARERGWDVEELHVERRRLDDVFRDITMGERQRT